MKFVTTPDQESTEPGCIQAQFLTNPPAPLMGHRQPALPADNAGQSTGSPRELAILDPLGLDGIRAKAAFLVLDIIRERTLEPFDMAVAFKGQDMRGDAVEEPAIMLMITAQPA